MTLAREGKSKTCFVMAPGAGGNYQSPFLVQMARQLAERDFFPRCASTSLTWTAIATSPTRPRCSMSDIGKSPLKPPGCFRTSY